MKRFYILIIALISFLTSCKEKDKTETSTEQNTATTLTPDKNSTLNQANNGQIEKKDSNPLLLSFKDSIELLRLTDTILTEIKEKNYLSIAKYIDPILGVRFSPYAYVDTLNNVVLSKETFQIEAGIPKQSKILWGVIDPTEKPIKMTLNQFMQKFVYDVDFAQPEKRSLDKFLGGGNSLNNLSEVYKGCHFTESYFSGFEEKYQGYDWRTLRLVFKKRNDEFYLVGIIHDEWTI